MELTTNYSELVQLIAEAIRGEVESLDDIYKFTVNARIRTSEGIVRETLAVELQANKLKELVDSLSSKEKRDETTLYDSNFYEILVREQSPLYGPSIMRMRRDGISDTDEAHDIVYKLSSASDEYLLFLLHEVSRVASVRTAWRYSITLQSSEETKFDVFELLRQTGPRFLTLQLASNKGKSINKYIKHANAFLFKISYNLDIALVQQRYLDELVRTGRIAKIRRSTISEIDVPRRYYEQDLIYHYQMGVATANPPLEYLSYYHVAEHFFESIFIEDLIERVQQKITHSGFSYKRKTDIKALIKYITNRTQLRDETFAYNEMDALKLTINKYVELSELRDTLRAYDSSLIEYYKDNPVTFSGGDTVDLNNNDPPSIISHLAKRIYKTRNSIVHSKEGEKARYIPFRHDKILVKEVPLVRFVAEAIIDKTAQIIN